MKAIITGDLHTEKGLRTNVVLSYIDYLTKYYFSNNIDYLFIDGDVFERSSNIKNESFIPLFLKFFKMKESGIKMIFILGNHDIMNVDNDSLVETFESFGTVVKKSLKMTIDDHDFYFQSYTKSKEDIPENGEYLITHLSIADFSFDNAYHMTEKNAFPRAYFENWKMVFTGHFHTHQHWNNICYVGSPYEVHRGEMGKPKGFVVLDTNREKWDFVEYFDAPKFLVLKNEDLLNLNKIDFKNKMVVVNISKKIKDYAKLRYILFEKGAVEVITDFISETTNQIGIIEKIKSMPKMEDIAKKGLLDSAPEELDKKILEKIFNKAINE